VVGVIKQITVVLGYSLLLLVQQFITLAVAVELDGMVLAVAQEVVV
jgi:hypothetical protein